MDIAMWLEIKKPEIELKNEFEVQKFKLIEKYIMTIHDSLHVPLSKSKSEFINQLETLKIDKNYKDWLQLICFDLLIALYNKQYQSKDSFINPLLRAENILDNEKFLREELAFEVFLTSQIQTSLSNLISQLDNNERLLNKL